MAKTKDAEQPTTMTVRVNMTVGVKRAFKAKCALAAITMKQFIDQKIAEFVGGPDARQK